MEAETHPGLCTHAIPPATDFPSARKKTYLFLIQSKTPFGLMAALTLPEMEEPLPSLHPLHPSPHSHQVWWVFNLLSVSGIHLPPPLLTLTPSGLVPRDVRWSMMCPWLRSPTLLLVPQPQNRPSFVSLSNSYSCCTTPVKDFPSLRKAFPAHLLPLTDQVRLSSHAAYLSLPLPQYSTLQTRHVFHFQMCLPFRGCKHPDDQDCGCLIPTFHSLHGATSQQTLNMP